MTPAAATGSDCLTALAGLIMIIFVLRLMIVSRRRGPSRTPARGARRDTAAASGAVAAAMRAAVVTAAATTKAAAVAVARNMASAGRARALWLTGAADRPGAGRRPRRSLIAALVASIAFCAVALQYAVPAADAQVLSHQPPLQQGQPRAESGQAASGLAAAESYPPVVRTLRQVNELIMDQQNRLARDQAALDDLAEIRAAWDQAAEAARYVAALHQYVAQRRKQASQFLDKLRAAKLRRRGPALYLQQALEEIRRLERQEAEAARTPLPRDQQQQVAEISRGLPADVESMIQRVVAVEYWFSKWGPARTGVWKVPGQLTLSGSDPASQGVSGRIAANKKEIAQFRRQIAWQRARHSPDVNRLRDALAQLRRQDTVLKGIKLRRKITRELTRGGWLALTPRQIAQIRDRAAAELARAPRVWPSPIQLGAIEAKAAKVAGQESAAQQAVRRRKGILTELSALRDAMRRAWDSTGRANKKARAEVEGLQSYLAAWKLTGPGQEPVPPASTVIRKVFLIDPKGKPVSVRDEETHPDNTASPYTSKNPLSWGGVQAVQDKTPGKAYMVTRFPPYSWKSLIWPFGGTLPVRLHDINVFKVGLSYLKGVKFRVVERSGYTDVKLRSPGEMLRINPPGPNLPGVMPVSLGEGVTVSVGTFFSWQYSFIPPGSDDVYGYADGPGKTKISVRRLVGSTSDGLARWWTDTTRGGEMTLVPAIPGPRLAPQLKAGGGLQVSIGWPVNLNHLLRTWNALATLLNHVIGHKVKLPHAELYPQGQAPGVGAVGFVIQVQVTPEHKYQISVQAADPRAWHEIELNIGREIVFSPYFYFGDKHVAGGVGFSGVPGNFVVGRSVADWPKLKALVEKGLSKVVPGLRAPMRRKILASIRRGLAQLEQQARAAAAAQQLADSWPSSTTTRAPAAQAVGHLIAAGHHVTTDGGTIQVDGIKYDAITAPSATRPDTIAANAAARYYKITAGGQPGRPGLIIMAGPATPPVSPTLLRVALARKTAAIARQATAGRKQAAALPRDIIFIGQGGHVTQLSGGPPLADRATIAAAAALAAHGHQVSIAPAASSTGRDVINVGGIPYIRYTPPAGATAAQIAADTAAAYPYLGTATDPATRTGLLIDLAGTTSQVTADDLTPAIAPYASKLPLDIIILGPKGAPEALSTTLLHQAYPALQTISGTTYAIYRFTTRPDRHIMQWRWRLSTAQDLARQAAKALKAYKVAVTDAPLGTVPPSGLNIELTGIPAAASTTRAVAKALSKAVAKARKNADPEPQLLRVAYPYGRTETYRITPSGKVQMLAPPAQPPALAPGPATTSPVPATDPGIQGLIVGGGRAADFPAPPSDAITLNIDTGARPDILGDISHAPFRPESFRYVYFERVPRFRHLVSEAAVSADDQHRAGLLRQALGLWRGPALAGVHSPWLDAVRATLEADRLTVRSDLNDIRLRQGEHSALVSELTGQATVRPTDERLIAQLMLALYRSGRQADALRWFEQTRRHLASEMGVNPESGLRTLHQQILRADPALAAPAAGSRGLRTVPRLWPPAVPAFTGRAGDLAELDRLLPTAGAAGKEPAPAEILAISGTAGVGKTALAAHWARRATRRFGDGHLHADLRGFDHSGAPASTPEVIRMFLAALGVPPDCLPPGQEAQAGLYRSMLADKQMLVVLDNARDEQQIRPLLPCSPRSLVLVTSRNQLTGLAATDGARLITLDVLPHQEAVQLLAARLGSQASAEPAAVSEIAILCARLPFALAVAAARAAARPTFPLAALAAELRDAAGRLDALDSGDPVASVRTMFSWSYNQLSTGAARMFRLLGLRSDPDITVPAAATLAGLDEPASRRLLRELSRAQMLSEHLPGRFSIHDLLRAYAADQARIHEEQPDGVLLVG